MFGALIRANSRGQGLSILTTAARLKGGGGGPPVYIPGLKFTDYRNSQYIAAISFI